MRWLVFLQKIKKLVQAILEYSLLCIHTAEIRPPIATNFVTPQPAVSLRPNKGMFDSIIETRKRADRTRLIPHRHSCNQDRLRHNDEFFRGEVVLQVNSAIWTLERDTLVDVHGRVRVSHLYRRFCRKGGEEPMHAPSPKNSRNFGVCYII